MLAFLCLLAIVILATQVGPSASQTCASVMGDGYVGSPFPTSCTRCEAGKYAIAGDVTCMVCPENSFSVSKWYRQDAHLHVMLRQ